MQTILYCASILLTDIMAGFLAWYAWRQRDRPGLSRYAGLALCICLLALSESLSMLSPSPAQSLFWFDVRIIFVASNPVFFLVFALEYNGHKAWLSRRTLVLALIVPAITQVVLWSNNLHDLWAEQEVGFHQRGIFWLVEISARIPSLCFMVHSVCSLLLLLTGIVVILVTSWNRWGLYRFQRLILSAGALITFVITIIPVFNLITQAELNPFTPGLGVSLLLTTLAVFSFRFIKRLPAAQANSQTQTLKTQSQRRQPVFFFVFFVMAASIAAFGYISYQNYNRQFQHQMGNLLLTIADLKVNGLKNWCIERMGDAQAIHQNPADTQAQVQIQTWLDSLQELFNYDRIFLLDTTGLEQISSPASPNRWMSM